MRTELFKISRIGGSLVRPLFADYPLDEKARAVTDSVMFGSALKVDFAFEKDQKLKKIYFPDSRWIDLETHEVYHDKAAFYKDNVEVGLDRGLNIYQNAKGTIIAYQEALITDVYTIEDLKMVPITLSIALDENDAAWGHVLLEEGTEAEGLTEFYEIKALKNIIQFRQ